MKLTKALFLATLVAGRLLICDSASAQDATTTTPASTVSTNAASHGSFRAPSIDRIAKTLDLTDAQKAQVQPILDEQFQKMQALRQDDSLSMDDKKAQMKAIRQSTADQMKTILTADQFAKWQAGMMHHHKQQQSSNNGSGQSTTSQPAQSQSAQ
jgi:Spy/CpxP family protein refolding chaperone